MAPSKPKVLLFDIGGVCVVSPFQAILDFEKANNIPTGYINFSISFSKPNGAWQKLERGEVPLDDKWFADWKADIQSPKAWAAFHKKHADKSGYNTLPPIPDVKVEELYWTMMGISRTPDPHMAPALKKLKASGRWRLAALSNTSIFPPGHPFNEPRPDDVKNVFDVFISSAHVGMRKPDKIIYDYTLKTLRDKWPEADIQPADIVFFDDIGENLKMGKQAGWRTVKVWLGKTEDTVKELEKITGESLSEGSARAKLALIKRDKMALDPREADVSANANHVASKKHFRSNSDTRRPSSKQQDNNTGPNDNFCSIYDTSLSKVLAVATIEAEVDLSISPGLPPGTRNMTTHGRMEDTEIIEITSSPPQPKPDIPDVWQSNNTQHLPAQTLRLDPQALSSLDSSGSFYPSAYTSIAPDILKHDAAPAPRGIPAKPATQAVPTSHYTSVLEYEVAIAKTKLAQANYHILGLEKENKELKIRLARQEQKANNSQGIRAGGASGVRLGEGAMLPPPKRGSFFEAPGEQSQGR